MLTFNVHFLKINLYMIVTNLSSNEYSAFYSNYLTKVEHLPLLDLLEISLHDFIKFVRNVPMDKIDYVYAEGKWTLKDIIQHIIDSERVFSYRALCIARNDQTALPSFDENFYAQQVDTSLRSISSLLSELATVRESTLSLFKTFSEVDLKKYGNAANSVISVRALGFIIIGHQKHHQEVFNERYM